MTTRIKLRRDTAANWTDNDPVLALGEAGYDTTNNQIRVGDGTSVWSLLHPIGGGLPEEFDAITLTATIPYVDPVLVASPVTFTRNNNSESTVDVIDTGLTIKRKNNGGAIYNSAGNVETGWNSNQSPLGTEWNANGWGDLADVKTRVYTTFNDACNGNVGEVVTHREFVMHDTINDKYYTFKFSWWQPGNGGGGGNNGVNQKSGLTYVRQLINTNPSVYFQRPAGNSAVVDNVDTGLTIKRDANGGLYNVQEDAEWDADVTPTGTLWNDEGWNDFTDITTRTWKPLYAAVHGQLGNHLVNRELLMQDTINNKYYVIKFTEWGQNNGGSFAYLRREINPSGTKLGVTFADGTVQKVAFNPGEMTISDNRITSHHQDITIETITDPLVNADINIQSANNIWMYAGGEYGVSIESNNIFGIGTGDSEFLDFSPGDMFWTGTNVVIDSYWSDMERSLQYYLTTTDDLWFRDEYGTWHRTGSTGLATYDSTGTSYTIPVAVNNTSTQLRITDIKLHDPDYDGGTWWYFNRNGYLNPPQMSITSWHQWNTSYQPTLKLGYPNTDVAIVNADVNSQYRGGYSIKIVGQRGYGHWADTTGWAGNGTDIQLWAGAGGESATPNQGGEGGSIDIHAGVGQGGRNGGDIYLTAGDATYSIENTSTNQVAGGTVNIRAGDALDRIVADKGLGGDINIVAGRGNVANGAVTIQTSINSSSYVTWGFNTDGGTIYPTLTVPINDNSNPSGTGQTLKFSDPSQQAIIYGPYSTAIYPNAERTIIQGAPGYAGTAGEGGDVYLWAGPGGDTNGNGGDIKVRAGFGNGSGSGGYLNFQAGDSQTGLGGWINIESGEATQGQGGAITLNARSGGKIELKTITTGTNQTWTFNPDGTVQNPVLTIETLPSATFAGQRAFVSNGVSSAAWGDEVSTSGSSVMSVWSNGSVWKYG